jgi:DNA invertase Pin-like site-specific DNA recombinase
MATYGYARVSSSDQSTDTQVQRLKAAGCKVVRTEKLSGKSREGRDQLATLLEFIGPGDVLVCVKLDRLGRSTRDVLNLVHELDQKGAYLRMQKPRAMSTGDANGRLILRLSAFYLVRELGPAKLPGVSRLGAPPFIGFWNCKAVLEA